MLWGLVASLVWAAYMAFARLGVVQGVAPIDFALLRYGSAGLLLLPLLLRRGAGDLGGIGWPRGVVLVLLAGPPFILLATLGFRFAPLAHGAVLQPATVVLASMAIASLLLGERLGLRRWAGAAVVVAGLALISGAGLAHGEAWRGDLCFVAAGLLWAAFTAAGRGWRIDPLTGTAVVAVLGGIAILPAWLLLGDGGAALLALGPLGLATQLLVQGPLSGIVAVYAFTRAVAALGAARAAMFPALVPGFSVLAGIPVAGEWPTPQQWLGLAVVLAGLPLAAGLLRFRPVRLR